MTASPPNPIPPETSRPAVTHSEPQPQPRFSPAQDAILSHPSVRLGSYEECGRLMGG